MPPAKPVERLWVRAGGSDLRRLKNANRVCMATSTVLPNDVACGISELVYTSMCVSTNIHWSNGCSIAKRSAAMKITVSASPR